MQVNTALLGAKPDIRNTLVFISLVNNFRNDLGALVDQAGVQRRQFGTVDRVSGSIFDK
jgi:hypothetical protein